MVRGQHSNGGRTQAQSVPYDTILLHAVAVGTLINESKSPAHRGRRWRRTDRTVAVLLETGLERLQRSARCRHDASTRPGSAELGSSVATSISRNAWVGGQGAQGPDGSVLLARIESASVLRRGRASWRNKHRYPPNAL